MNWKTHKQFIEPADFIALFCYEPLIHCPKMVIFLDIRRTIFGLLLFFYIYY